MKRKYMITKETKVVDGVTLHRIKAFRGFGEVKRWEFGGFIEKEENLSHEGNCWVSGDACVFGNACVRDDAWVSGNARVYGNAIVERRACVYGYAKVYDNAYVSWDSEVYDNAVVRGNSRVSADCIIKDSAVITGDGDVCGRAVVQDRAIIIGGVVYGNAVIKQRAVIKGGYVYDNATVSGCSVIAAGTVNGGSILDMNAYIEKTTDCIFICGFDKEFEKITFFRCKDGSIKVCAKGFSKCWTMDEFSRRIRWQEKDEEKIEVFDELIKLVKNHFKERTE